MRPLNIPYAKPTGSQRFRAVTTDLGHSQAGVRGRLGRIRSLTSPDCELSTEPTAGRHPKGLAAPEHRPAPET